VLESLRALLKRRGVSLVLAILSISAVVWFSYARVLNLGFTGWDTLALIEWSYDNVSRSASQIFFKPLLPGLPYYRPLSNASYALDFFLWRTDALGYHLTDIFAHWAMCVGLVVMGIQATRRIAVGWLAGLLLALHPAFGTMIANIAYRQDTLVTLAMVWSLIFTNSFLNAQGWRKWILRALAWLAFLFALGFKESGMIALPLVIGLVAYQNRQRLRRAFLETLPFLAITVGYVALHLLVTPRNSVPPTHFAELNFALPFIFFRELAAPNLNPRWLAVMISIPFFTATIFLLARNWQRAPRVWIVLWAAWMLLVLAVYIASDVQEFVERYAYLVAAPLMLLIATAIMITVPTHSQNELRANYFAKLILVGIVIVWLPSAPLWGLPSQWVKREELANAYLIQLDQIVTNLPAATTLDLENVPPKWIWLNNMKSYLDLKWAHKKIRLGKQSEAKKREGSLCCPCSHRL